VNQPVLVVGQGVAGLTCAKLLAQLGWQVEIWGQPTQAAPHLVLNELTQNLLQTVWQVGDEIWRDAHPLTERKVIWGAKNTISSVAQPSVVIRSAILAEHLQHALMRAHPERVWINRSVEPQDMLVDAPKFKQQAASYAWIIDATGRSALMAKLMAARENQTCGERCILSLPVRVAPSTAHHACWLESTTDGWVFWMPTQEKNRWIIQIMTPKAPPDPPAQVQQVLAQTRLPGMDIIEMETPITLFRAAPQIVSPLCGKNWLAVGDAAFSVDPICGDGTGYAIREAILGTAVLESIRAGLSAEACLRHYTLRLQQAFSQHVKACIQYYLEAFALPVWKTEIEQMRKAVSVGLNDAMALEYRLQGFKLVPLQ
jgi:flavin-dependent dehydrogenase